MKLNREEEIHICYRRLVSITAEYGDEYFTYPENIKLLVSRTFHRLRKLEGTIDLERLTDGIDKEYQL